MVQFVCSGKSKFIYQSCPLSKNNVALRGVPQYVRHEEPEVKRPPTSLKDARFRKTHLLTCMGTLPAHVSVHHLHGWSLCKSADGSRSSGTGVVDGRELP